MSKTFKTEISVEESYDLGGEQAVRAKVIGQLVEQGLDTSRPYTLSFDHALERMFHIVEAKQD